jgi:hypothetical protein
MHHLVRAQSIFPQFIGASGFQSIRDRANVGVLRSFHFSRYSVVFFVRFFMVLVTKKRMSIPVHPFIFVFYSL